MRSFTTALVAAASLLPSALAAGQAGFCLGANEAGGACKTQQDWEDDMDAIKSNTGASIVRVYAASQCDTAKNILPAAKAKGFKVVVGVWPDTEESLEADKGALQQYVPQYQDQVYAVTVGSETLYRGNFTGPELLSKINEVKSALPQGTKIGTVDSWNKYADGTADAVIQGGVDILMINAFAFWQSTKADNASHVYMDDVMQALSHIQSVSGSLDKIEVWNGETGWPTDGGTNYGDSVAGTQNAEQFYQQGYCGLLKWGVSAFYFEGFDEPQKPPAIGLNGQPAVETVWGAMTADRKPKFNLNCS